MWRVHVRTAEGLTDDEAEIARSSIRSNLDAQDAHTVFDAAVAEAREKLADIDGTADVELTSEGASVAPYDAPDAEPPSGDVQEIAKSDVASASDVIG